MRRALTYGGLDMRWAFDLRRNFRTINLPVCVGAELVRIDLNTGTVLARLPAAAANVDNPAFVVIVGEQSVWLVYASVAIGIARIDRSQTG